MADAVALEPWVMGTPALEIGCGLGLAGLVGVSLGLRVTFSDYDPAPLDFVARSAAANRFGADRYVTRRLDWRDPPGDQRLPVILGADVLYEEFMTDACAEFLIRTLPRDGLALIADPDRVCARPFRSLLERAGMTVKLKPKKVGKHGSKTKGVVYRITR